MNVNYKAVGYKSGKVYATGRTKARLMRELQMKYPNEIETPDEYKKTKSVSKLFPEEIRIIKEVQLWK